MIYLGVFATACATLILEVALTRLFSIAYWYHFAFLVISIALLGFGASGTFLTLFKSLLNKPYKNLSIMSMVFSFSIIIVFLVCRIVPFDPARIAWDTKQIFYIFLYSLILSIPFFFSGLTISIAVSHLPHIINKIYFSDLIGAGIGALSVSFLFSLFEGPGVIIVASLMAALGSIFFTLKEERFFLFTKICWIIIMFIFIIVKPYNLIKYFNISMSPYKDLKLALLYPDSSLLKTNWNAFSRVDIVDSPAVRYAPGLSLEYRKPLPHQLGVTIDGAGLNAITEYDENSLKFISYLPSFLPYYLRLQTPESRLQTSVLIIEPGGGLPVLMAFKGSETPASILQNPDFTIDVVEKNPLIVRLIKDNFGKFAGDIYNHRGVKIWSEEGRSFLRKTERLYDLIDLSKPGASSPTSTGLYGLLEDYTFTSDAFKEYIERLKENGFLSITRYLLPPPREEARIVSLALDAFKRIGIQDPSDRIVAIRSWGTITILIKKTPFENLEIESIREFSSSRRFDIVYLKGLRQNETNIYNIFKEDLYYKTFEELLNPENRLRLYEDYLFDITPTTDDRPFFFHFFRIKKIVPTYHSMKDKWQPFMEGGYLVPLLFLESLALSFLLILLPLFWSKRENGKGEKGNRLKIILYFFSIGLGFMFIEIAMIQKFILFLGKPIYSISLVLFSILLSTATGSYFSKRGEVKDIRVLRKRLKTGVTFIILILSAYYFFLDKLLIYFLGSDFIIRSIITFFLLSPVGFFMGFPFPIGIKFVDHYNRRLIPWVWASNGSASVVATSLSVMIAITFGFSTVLLISACIYLFCSIMLSTIGKIENS